MLNLKMFASMETAQNVYNVIWVDDEIDSLYPDNQNIFRGEGVNVIAAAHTSMEFREIMDLCYDRVDAVITDANFNNGKIRRDIEKDISGLMDIGTCIETCNKKRAIPFYLYTGRIDLLESKCQDGQLDYFECNNRIFSKGDLVELLQQIKQDVDHIKSPSFTIRKKYAKELAAARRIEGNEKFLFDALLKEESGQLENVEDSFNAVRKLVERIIEQSKTLKILPGITELNKVCNFLKHEPGIYKLNDDVEIMPLPLVQSFKYLLDVTQDGSHDGSVNLKLGVSEYVRHTGNINLFRGLLFIAMDLCLWYDNYSMQHPDEERNALDWELIRDCEGKVVEINEHWVCNNYELQKPKDGKFSVGDNVCILGSIDHKSPFDYIVEGKQIHVDKYVHVNKICINK